MWVESGYVIVCTTTMNEYYSMQSEYVIVCTMNEYNVATNSAVVPPSYHTAAYTCTITVILMKTNVYNTIAGDDKHKSSK